MADRSPNRSAKPAVAQQSTAGVAIPVDRRARAVAAVRKALIERKMTQVELADTADCHEKTIQNLIAGKSVRDQTLFDVCMVLGLDYEEIRDDWHGSIAQHETGLPASPAASPSAAPVGSSYDRQPIGGMVAPIYMGAYSKHAVDHYPGSYLTLRADFTRLGHIVAYRTDIAWDDEWPSLLFQETGRPDQSYSHRGRLYVPASSMFIHLVSLTKGAMRMIVVSQIDQDGIMRGLITTLNKQRASFVPVSTAIVYIKGDNIPLDAMGDIAPGHASHAAYTAHLAGAVNEGYARLVGP
ncbi:MAG: helix-turn-helix transcriptional regulator [Hyphomicrobium aestuarii]|nr:helix-turn-helix transcriptional regulator [Hyphomicrobium aestuarii]